MKRAAIFGIVLGALLEITLLFTNDLPVTYRTLLGVGWWILLIAAIHLPQTFFRRAGLVGADRQTGH